MSPNKPSSEEYTDDDDVAVVGARQGVGRSGAPYRASGHSGRATFPRTSATASPAAKARARAAGSAGA